MSANSASKNPSEGFRHATGTIEFGFINDYMFRIVMQRNLFVLKGLVCSLLHLQPQDISSIVITNPILEGGAYNSKEFILDIEILLNNSLLLNLELQVLNEHNWPERSLSYLCRRFDQLAKGEDYINCKPAIHIGFLDFAPFPEYAEFYATYKLLNIKNHHLYSDKFALSVIDLSHIELATEEDIACGIDRWARLFKAKTWEELKMIAQDNPAMTQAAENLYVLNTDEQARARARARQEAIIHEKAMQQRQADLERQLLEQQEARERAMQEAIIHEKAMQHMQQRQADLERQLQEQQEAREDLKKQLAENAEKYHTAMAELEQLRAELADRRHP